MSDIIKRNIIRFIILVLLQVLLLNNINLTSWQIKPFIYILFIMLLPFDTPNWSILLLAFLLGFIIDLFSNSLGIHAFATVFVAFIRPYILQVITSKTNYQNITSPHIAHLGFIWFLKYTLILVFVHHFVYYFMEAFSFKLVFDTLMRVGIGTIYTSIIIFLSQLFISKNR